MPRSFLSLIRNQPTNIVWLVNLQTVYPAVLMTEIWQWTPFMFLIMLAGLTAVSRAARSGLGRRRVVVANLHARDLPVIQPVIVVAVLFRALDIFKLFDIIVPLTGGGPGTTTETASLYLYILGFRNFRLGYAAAASYLVLMMFTILLTMLLRRISRETTEA
jgi:multiple sugar transport system permease protein